MQQADSNSSLNKQRVTLLRLDVDTWRALQDTRSQGSRFTLTFPHAVAKNARRGCLALIAVDDGQGKDTKLVIGLVRSVQASATLDSRVTFDLLSPIIPTTLSALLSTISEPPLRAGAQKLLISTEAITLISEKLGARIIDIISSNVENTSALSRIISVLEKPKYNRDARALQYDAVNLAIRAFGYQGDATSVDVFGQTALATISVEPIISIDEDSVVDHDARSISGWTLNESDVTGRAIFKKGNEELEVITANTRPLEELFGVDLIYFNKARGSLVLVQYKMMEPKVRHDKYEEQEWSVRTDAQLSKQILQMEAFDKDLDPTGPYRLNSGAFYLKLVKRNAATNTAGILLSLGHVVQLINEAKSGGSQKSISLTYSGLDGHYLRGEAWVELVRSGYIGSRGATTVHLKSLIDAALKGGRAVVAAIQSKLERPATELGRLSDFDPTGGEGFVDPVD